ncbi:MAG TPA: 4Fe-4S dicluster domain-containing protein [Candidatus Omnitrophota bacterium]|nr:4Fe-4S dicluster domain-containing protein [Candidatus Omnitrophota bacterium]HPD85432.1 4Fe-4S dicluster domain-containing protein [Candidatus Omnitrophota bacterium]HRZ04067.1 4Fe-4S dicluster domain-containing protein [Candidatus Omnitrophota bacterium]
MPHVVTEPCLKCKYTNCCVVCPVEAFREDAEMLVIDPDVCIDCGACVSECPVHAICAQEDVPEKFKSYIALNATKSKTLPPINQKKTPLAK